MAALTVQDIVEAGLNASYPAAAGGGDTAANLGGDVLLHVKNADAGAHTVTVTATLASQKVPSLGVMAKANVAVAVPAGEDRFIGPFAQGAFNDAGGNILITYDGVTAVTIAALRLPKA